MGEGHSPDAVEGTCRSGRKNAYAPAGLRKVGGRQPGAEAPGSTPMPLRGSGAGLAGARSRPSRSGQEFIVSSEVEDFEAELESLRNNKELMEFLDERSREEKIYSLAEVKKHLGLD